MLIDGYKSVKMFRSTSPPLPGIIPLRDYDPLPLVPTGKSGEEPSKHLCRGQRIYTVKDEAIMVQCYINIV